MMKNVVMRFFWLSLYATAMALMEAVVVAYIRALLEITPDHVTLDPYVTLEICREAATLVMLVAVGWLAGRNRIERLSYGLFAFGWWDIWYYIWLKVFMGWPDTLLSWDILFLIPVRWWGPVLSPVLIALLICISTVLAVVRLERGRPVGLTRLRVASLGVGGFLALYVFMSDALHALLAGQPDWDALRPGPFKWSLFLIALALMAIPALQATWPLERCSAGLENALSGD